MRDGWFNPSANRPSSANAITRQVTTFMMIVGRFCFSVAITIKMGLITNNFTPTREDAAG